MEKRIEVIIPEIFGFTSSVLGPMKRYPTKRATTVPSIVCKPNGEIVMYDMKTECGSFIYFISKN